MSIFLVLISLERAMLHDTYLSEVFGRAVPGDTITLRAIDVVP